MIKTLLGFACLLSAFVAIGEANAQDNLVFDVYRGDQTRFGTHEVKVSGTQEERRVDIKIRLRAGLGPITVFRYEHDSVELWQGDQVLSMTSRTLKDGETYDVSIQKNNGIYEVSGREQDGEPFIQNHADLILSSHWAGYQTGSNDIIDTQHGHVMASEIVYLGQTQIEGDGDMIPVEHYRINSSLSVDLYYDETGRWAGCEFEARGQSVRYIRRPS